MFRVVLNLGFLLFVPSLSRVTGGIILTWLRYAFFIFTAQEISSFLCLVLFSVNSLRNSLQNSLRRQSPPCWSQGLAVSCIITGDGQRQFAIVFTLLLLPHFF